jgi:sugar/nucleoside kinase (ribokinase family)
VAAVDVVAVGHVTFDETALGTRPGGAVYYAAITAQRLGLRVGLLTSSAPDFPLSTLLPGIEIANVGASRTTRYAVAEDGGGRQLTLLARADDIEVGCLPPAWQEAPLSLLCPVASEVDPALAAAFPDAAVGVLPQGWMRRRGQGGVIARAPWEDALDVLPHAQMVVFSEEDVGEFRDDATEWFQEVPVGALTHGAAGATLFVNGEPYHVQADPVREVDATGAGDVFAAVLLIEYHRRADPWEAAAAAACAAAASVTAPGAEAIPDRAALDARLAAYVRRAPG